MFLFVNSCVDVISYKGMRACSSEYGYVVSINIWLHRETTEANRFFCFETRVFIHQPELFKDILSCVLKWGRKSNAEGCALMFHRLCKS